MGRFPRAAARIATTGAVAFLAGATILIGVAVQVTSTAAFADTAPFEVACPGTPLGDVVLNDVVVTGQLSPASPAPGQQFSVDDLQAQIPLPASLLAAVQQVGASTLGGTLTSTIDVSGATPSSMSTGPLANETTIPGTIPPGGITVDTPPEPVSLGPFTATSSSVDVSLAATSDLALEVAGIDLSLTCSAFPDDVVPQSGFSPLMPPGLPVSPVIAVAGGTAPPPPSSAVTGPYELYCPHTPVGDLVFNGVTTTATISAGSLSAGDQFQVTGYQTTIPVPAGPVAAAAGLANSSFDGLAAGAVDVYGAGPAQVNTGSMPFDVAIPDPVPAAGVNLMVPLSPTTLGPFTAAGGPITVAQDQTLRVVAALSSKAFTMSCTAYPNDAVATSGSTGTGPAPGVQPIRPVIALGSASGSTPASTTTTTGLPGTVGPAAPVSGPYELYCPGSPVGDVVLNDTTTSGTITPASVTAGGQFQLSGLQMGFSIPQAVAQQAENLGLDTLSGDVALFLGGIGVYGVGDGGFENPGGPPAGVIVTGPGPIEEFPPGEVDLSFDVTLPDPVPAAGVQFTASPLPGTDATFTALGGPIQMTVAGVDLNVTEFGDSFGMFCDTFPNDTDPTGLSATVPSVAPVEPLVASGQAAVPPPVTAGPGPYELYCPGTPVGNVVLNGVTASATLSPADPTSGEQFSVTGYQTDLSLPASIANAAAALGNVAIDGTATTTVEAQGATPASLSSGSMSFDAPITQPVPATGLSLVVPATPASLGPFTATGPTVTISQGDQVALTLTGTGSDTFPLTDVTCTSYPDNSLPSGVANSQPFTTPISPILVTTAPTTTTGSSGPYELYCPGTPVGNIALNDVTTSAALSPADPAPGQQFQVTGYQTDVELPSAIVSAAAALGNTAIIGTAATALDASGATPSSLSSGTLTLDAPIPEPVPPDGLELQLPLTPLTLGPFTASASGGPITITEAERAQLTLDVSGSALALTCTTYPNDVAPSGIVTSPPAGEPVAPLLASADASTQTTPPTSPPGTIGGNTGTSGSTPPDTATTPTTSPSATTPTTSPPATTPTTSAPTTSATPTTSASGGSGTTVPADGATTRAPATKASASGAAQASGGDPAPATVVTSPSGSLAFTGAGAQLVWLTVLGASLAVFGLALLFLVDTPRRLRRALAHAVPGRRSRPDAPGTWQSRR